MISKIKNDKFRSCQIQHVNIMGKSKNVIPVKTGIQKPLISLDSRLRGSDKLVIIRG